MKTTNLLIALGAGLSLSIAANAAMWGDGTKGTTLTPKDKAAVLLRHSGEVDKRQGEHQQKVGDEKIKAAEKLEKHSTNSTDTTTSESTTSGTTSSN